MDDLKTARGNAISDRYGPGAAAIDAGAYVDGTTVDVVGAPGLGAYEFGKPKWTAGANIQVPNFPDEEAGWDATANGVK